MKIFEIVNIDNKHGIGAVPNNNEVDYLGLRVIMKPSVFLSLAAGGVSDGDVGPSHHVRQHMEHGEAIGAPFLVIKIPNEWIINNNFSQPAVIKSHDGRHRMITARQLDGDVPIETHLFFGSLRHRDITPEIADKLNKGLLPQAFSSLDFKSGMSRYQIPGPLFQIIK